MAADKMNRKRIRNKDCEITMIDETSHRTLKNQEIFTEDLDYAIALSLQEEQQKIIKNDSPSHDNTISLLDKGKERDSSNNHEEDIDHAIALSLQKEEENEINEPFKNFDKKFSFSPGFSSQNDKSRIFSLKDSLLSPKELWDPKSIIDPQLELNDPHPNIHNLYVQFDAMFFDRALCNGGVVVQWGKRMTRCAGLCCYEGRGGLCSIRLSEPLLKLRPRKDLVETLLHEMIHALLFVTANNRDREGHGPQFLSHMNRINKLTGTNITVYHSFHDEVSLYQQHWWRCDGPCQNRKPFYGTVRRAVNRAPSKNDHWWAEHQRTCGGKFIKIKEPEGYTSSRRKKKRKMTPTSNAMTDTTEITTNNTTGIHTGTTGIHTGTTGIHTGTTRIPTGTTGITTGTTGIPTGTTGITTSNTRIHAGIIITGTHTREIHTTKPHTGSGTHFQIDITKNDSSIKDKREKMLKAAEKRLTTLKNKGRPTPSRNDKNNNTDIRIFMTTPPRDSTLVVIDSTPDSTHIDLDSTPDLVSTHIDLDSVSIDLDSAPSKSTDYTSHQSLLNSTPSSSSKLTPPTSDIEKRTCPVCGRNDIPKVTINIHIGFCLEEMNLNSSDDDNEG